MKTITIAGCYNTFKVVMHKKVNIANLKNYINDFKDYLLKSQLNKLNLNLIFINLHNRQSFRVNKEPMAISKSM